jgi:predicted dehydrogenase
MRNPLNIGVVGYGYWGPNLVRNLCNIDRCRLTVACDVSEQRLAHLRRMYPAVSATREYEHMLNGAGLDAVMIATPLRFHYPMAKASLLAGKHTFVEKPMASSSEECEELIALSKQKGLVLMVGHTFLFSGVIRRLREIVRHLDFGDVHYLCARRLNLGLFQRDINVTWDLAPHDISIILYILEEEPLSVNCRGEAHVTPGIEDVSMMSLNFRKGRSAMIHSSWLEPRKVREMTIVGSRRMVVYDDVATLDKIRVYDARVECPPHYDTFAEFHFSYHYGDMYVPYVKQEEPLKLECQHFVDCIWEGKSPVTSGRQGLRVVRILEAASQSLQNGGAEVRLASSTEATKPNASARPEPLTVGVTSG